MSPYETIVDAVHGLSLEEKFKLRVLLDEELRSPTAPPKSTHKTGTSALFGLFADEPELMDRVMESVYEHRSTPLRIEE